MKFGSWPFFSGSSSAKAAVGIEMRPDGIAAASISAGGKNAQHRFKLDWCEFSEENDFNHQIQIFRAWLSKHQVKKARLNLVLHRTDFELLMVEPPEVPVDEMKEAIRWRVKELISFPLEEAVVDVFLLPEDAFRGRMKMAYVTVARLERIKSFVDALNRKGLDLCHIDIPEMTSRNVAALLPEEELGVAVLRFDDESGVIHIAQGRNVYLSRALTVNIDQVSKLDRDEMEFLQLEIQRSLDYYESQLGKGTINKVYFAPNTRNLAEATAVLNSSIGAQVSLLDVRQLIQINSEVKNKSLGNAFSAIGAALRDGVAV